MDHRDPRKWELTDAERDELVAWQQRYLGYGLSTAPADRARAEAAFAAAYRRIGREPVPVIWVDSPVSASVLIAGLQKLREGAAADGTGGEVHGPIWARVVEDLRAKLTDDAETELETSLRTGLAASLWASLADTLGASLAASLGDRLWASLGASVVGGVETRLRNGVALSLRDTLGTRLGDHVWPSLQASLRDSLAEGLADSLGDSLREGLLAGLRAGLGASLRARLRFTLADALRASWGVRLVAELRDAVTASLTERGAVKPVWTRWWGQMDLYWVAYYRFCETVLGVRYAEADHDGLALMDAIGQSCGWWYPYDGLIIACERPEIVQMEEITDAQPVAEGMPATKRYRLHATDGPAVRFRDGWSIYAWHGVRVPAKLIETPSQITRDDVVAETNAEVRRAMYERVGPDRYADLLGVQPVHTDAWNGQTYTLLRTIEPDTVVGDYLQFVRVQCPSTGRVYHLSVPPTVHTARAAVAWTFGHTEETYRPEIEQ